MLPAKQLCYGSALLIALFCSPEANAQESLKVDPLLVRQAEAIWDQIAIGENSIWPGWNATDTPIMFYLPNVQEVLINHPDPPEKFSLYEGPVRFRDLKIYVHSGQTIIEADGQNTSRTLFGTPTLIVADTLSNKKNQLSGLIAGGGSNREKVRSLSYSSLRADPYDQMAMIAHEAFHVFQSREIGRKMPDETQARLYPCLSVVNNVGFALEADALIDCANAEDEAGRREAAIRWLAVRLDRRKKLPQAIIDYEDQNEFLEGLAKYVEVKLMQQLEGSKPARDLWLAQGFEGFDDLSWYRNRQLETLRDVMRGRLSINNDRYGTAPIKFREYYAGMGIALLLDQVAANWKTEISNPKSTLTTLAIAALKPEQSELAEALAELRGGSGYEELVKQKTELAKQGEEDTRQMLKRTISGPNTNIVLDESAMPTAAMPMVYTPFGIRALDENRAIYRSVALSGKSKDGKYSYEQAEPILALRTVDSRLLKMQLLDSVTPEKLRNLLTVEGEGPWIVENLKLDLPGLSVTAARAEVVHSGREIFIRFLPEQ